MRTSFSFLAMQPTPELPDPFSDVQRVAEARFRLDRAISGYNRHSLIGDRYRRSLERFKDAQTRFESVRSTVQETQATVAERRAARVRDLEHWREARAAMAAHRASVEQHVREYVHRLRDEGMTPEGALVAVKRRLSIVVTNTAPDAPPFEASQLATDIGAWAIAAYFDAA